MTELNPPADICGNIGASQTKESRALVARRARWINSLPDHISPRQIARALGVSPWVVIAAAPGRYAYVPAAVMPTTVHVTMPELPGIEVKRDRPETDPRAGIVSPSRRHMTIEQRIEVIRQMWIRTRAVT